jgi:iron complex outermembrane receptor protein
MKLNISRFKKLLLMLVMVFSFTMIYAQERVVTGLVTDANDGIGLPGVSIVVKGTTLGTTTNIDGKYTLTVDENAIIIYSFVGYSPQEITVGAQSQINVVLSVDSENLSEVVVIGYGTSKKKDLTGSIQTVSADDFNKGAISSPQQLLNGKIAGVQITDGGGAPGASSTIRIRGGSSLSASNDPLIIIDGVPLDNDDVSGMRNPLNIVNPNDIETFTVLKDASATAIYGSRASNGVIIITTKKGSLSGIKIDYSGNMSVSSPIKNVDILDATEYREILTEKYPDYTDLMGDSDTDWQDDIYGNAISTDHNIGVSGAIKDKLPFRASVGYTDSDGILDESNMKRTTTALNLTPSFFDDHLRVNISAKGMFIKNNFSNEDAIGSAIYMDPTQAIKGDEYSDFGGYYAWAYSDGTPNTISPSNARAQIDQKIDKSKVNRFVGNAQFDYKFHFLPDLRANLNLGMDVSRGEDDGTVQILEDAAWDSDSYYRGGSYSTYLQKKKNKLLDFYLQYNKDLPKLDSRLEVMGGYSWQHFWSSSADGSWFNEADDDGETANGDYSVSETENYLVSFFGRLNYIMSDKYYVTFTLRDDGSSRFSEDNRWGLFPSVALAWDMKDESFLKESNLISTLKMKLSYGVTGQQDIGEDYGYFATYDEGESTAQYVFYDGDNDYEEETVTTLRANAYDADLKWEETATYNFGLDYGFLKNRISGSLDIYYRETTDLLNTISVAAGTNLSNEVTTNVGSLENRGFEFSVNTIPIQSKDLTWSIGANITYNKNEITKLTNVDDPDYIGNLTGSISGGTGNTVQINQVGSAANSFFVYKQIYDTAGKPIEGLYEDVNGDGEFDEDDLSVGQNSTPDVILGIYTSLNYKNWDFSMSGRANLGVYAYNNMASNSGYYSNLQSSGEYLMNLHSDVKNTEFEDAQYFSDYYVQNASFFKMDNITLGYNLSELMGMKLNMRVYSSINNVFVITDYDGIDPEIDGGIDNNIYPRPRTFLFGVNVTF